jgi:hypothetical protein
MRGVRLSQEAQRRISLVCLGTGMTVPASWGSFSCQRTEVVPASFVLKRQSLSTSSLKRQLWASALDAAQPIWQRPTGGQERGVDEGHLTSDRTPQRLSFFGPSTAAPPRKRAKSCDDTPDL